MKRSRTKPEIKVTRNSARPQIKASRGPGGPTRRRKVASSPRQRQPGADVARPRGAKLSEADQRVAETRRQTLRSMGSAPPRARDARQPARNGHGGGSVRAVSAGSAGSAGSAAARVVQEVARPVSAVTRPVLRVVTGGLEAIPQAAERATPAWRSRLLILLVGLLAAGLIYINVGKLEYGDGYAQYAQRSLELQRENTVLRSRIARLNSADRIQRYAQARGMYVPAPEQFTYLRPRRSDALRSRDYAAPLTQARPSVEGPSGGTGATAGTGTATAVPQSATGAGL